MRYKLNVILVSEVLIMTTHKVTFVVQMAAVGLQ